MGQLETGGLSGGGSRHNNPSMKCSQLGEKKEQTSPDMTEVAFKKK